MMNYNKIYNRILKRVIDFFLSLLLIVLLVPLIILIIIIKLLCDGFPIFYMPIRGGYKNRNFKIYKFRTMVINADKIGGDTTGKYDPRITKFGNFLRKTKLDEIPQLFNILFGSMSFIGPRPEVIKYTQLYSGDELKIFNVRPGITDYSSIKYVSLDEVVGSENADKNYEDLVLPEKNKLRLKYANEVSLKTDIQIFFNTIFVVLKKIILHVFKKRWKNTMEYLKLKNSNLIVSRICMGCDPMGGHAWGQTDDDEMVEAVNVAIDNGINFFDVADIYGLGKAETLLGKALGNKRSKVIIATKFGVRRTLDNKTTYYDNSPDWIKFALFQSLKRLNTNYIDIFQIHYRDYVTPLKDVVETLEDLKRSGLIRFYGLSNISQKDLTEIKPYKRNFICFQDQFSLAYRNNEKDIIKISRELEMTPLTWGSLGQGILSGKYDRNVRFDSNDRRSRPEYINFHGEKLQKNIDIVDQLKILSKKYEKSSSAIAIRFILDYLEDSVVLVGMKRKDQVISNCEAVGWNLNILDINKLDSISE